MSDTKKPTPPAQRPRQVVTITSITVRTRPGETEDQALARGIARIVQETTAEKKAQQ